MTGPRAGAAATGPAELRTANLNPQYTALAIASAHSTKVTPWTAKRLGGEVNIEQLSLMRIEHRSS
jgi:hypothetical protein